MSDSNEVRRTVQRAETNLPETHEIEGYTVQNGRLAGYTVTVATKDDAPDCQESENADADVTESDTDPFEWVGDRTDDAEHDSADTDERDDERMSWTVNGTEMGYNALEKVISTSSMEWPDDHSGDNLAELLREASNVQNSAESGGSDDTSDSSDNSGQNDGVTDEYLTNHGVKERNLSDARDHREQYGVCHHETCERGAYDAEHTGCSEHADWSEDGEDDEETPDVDREVSDLNNSEMELLANLMNEGMSKQEALNSL